MLWLGFAAKDFYRSQLGYIMADNVNWLAAIIFYVIFMCGVVFFVIEPALEKRDWTMALYRGAFFGFITYATYDLTNLATLKDWPLLVTAVDLIWGTAVTAVVSALTCRILTSN